MVFISFNSGPCLNFTFWNNAGVPFILYSSLKPEGYLVTGPKLHLHYVIRDGQHKRKRRENDVEVLSEVRLQILLLGSRCGSWVKKKQRY